MDVPDSRIPIDSLPKCDRCQGLLRPHVVWFGEDLFPHVLTAVDNAMEKCDVCLVVGYLDVYFYGIY